MKIITATEAARSFAEILNMAHYQGQSFTIRRGKTMLARIVPAEPVSKMKVKDLKAFFDSLPKLDKEDQKKLERDFALIRKSAGKEKNLWD